MRRPSRLLTTRVAQLEATIEPPVSLLRTVVVYPGDGESVDTAMQRQGHNPDNPCVLLMLRYGSSKKIVLYILNHLRLGQSPQCPGAHTHAAADVPHAHSVGPCCHPPEGTRSLQCCIDCSGGGLADKALWKGVCLAPLLEVVLDSYREIEVLPLP
jgi:hypothetical protein